MSAMVSMPTCRWKVDLVVKLRLHTRPMGCGLFKACRKLRPPRDSSNPQQLIFQQGLDNIDIRTPAALAARSKILCSRLRQGIGHTRMLKSRQLSSERSGAKESGG